MVNYDLLLVNTARRGSMAVNLAGNKKCKEAFNIHEMALSEKKLQRREPMFDIWA